MLVAARTTAPVVLSISALPVFAYGGARMLFAKEIALDASHPFFPMTVVPPEEPREERSVGIGDMANPRDADAPLQASVSNAIYEDDLA